ncbi:MAG: hypothetical protein H0Z34_14445 [Brevibacillus sp.]|nr:hypothetical protein [Brevibacillus sp.]
MKRRRFLYIGLLALSLAAGCSAPSGEDAMQPGDRKHAPNGDLQEMTASVSELPTFLDKLDPRIKDVYQLAAQHHDTLQWIPCYCGCGESAGHQHNGNCFIKEVKENGSVVWDDHGTRCGVCLETALISGQLAEQGKSAKEIRTLIDEKYQKGYAKPTPTPMPM